MVETVGSNPVARANKPLPRGQGWALWTWGITFGVWATLWGMIKYVDQPERSPTWRKSFVESLGAGLQNALFDAGGPTMYVCVRILRLERAGDPYGLMACAAVFLALAIAFSRAMRLWPLSAHLAVAGAWLTVWAVVNTALFMK